MRLPVLPFVDIGDRHRCPLDDSMRSICDSSCNLGSLRPSRIDSQMQYRETKYAGDESSPHFLSFDR
jgi:hypothetical protein